MSILYYYIDEQTRELRPEASRKVVAQKDHNADVIRVGVPEALDSVDLETSAVRCMYQRPKETEVRSKTATYYDTSGGYLWYDWTLQEGDTVKAGKINFSVCLQHIEDGLLTVDWNTTIGEIHVKTSYHSDDSDEGDESITPTVAQRVAVLESVIQGMAGGAPVVVGSASDMTDTAQIYVLSTDGNWYYHNGTAWVAGGTYGAVGTDRTLTQAGIPADAETVGIRINAMSSDIEEIRDDLDNLDIETDTTLSIAGKPADAKAVGDALAEAITGESLEDGESMKYVLSSKYDDFKLVDGYGYFDAVTLLNNGYGGPAPYMRGERNVIFRILYGNRATLSPNYLTDGLFSPDFPVKSIPWMGPPATADPTFMGDLPEGFYISIPDNPIRRGSRFLAIPKSVYGDAASLGVWVADYLDGSVGVKLDVDNIKEYDPASAITAATGGVPSIVTVVGETVYKGFLTWAWSDTFDFENSTANIMRMYNTFGLTQEISTYAKECAWFEKTTRLWYRVKASSVSARTADAVKDYLLNVKHLKFYYVAPETTTAEEATT